MGVREFIQVTAHTAPQVLGQVAGGIMGEAAGFNAVGQRIGDAIGEGGIAVDIRGGGAGALRQGAAGAVAHPVMGERQVPPGPEARGQPVGGRIAKRHAIGHIDIVGDAGEVEIVAAGICSVELVPCPVLHRQQRDRMVLVDGIADADGNQK